jgi:hypothetical protein
MDQLSEHGASSPDEGSLSVDQPLVVPDQPAARTSVLDRRHGHPADVREGREEVPEATDQVAEALDPTLLADLDVPRLVLSEGYIGPDRRADGLLARWLRSVHGRRPSLSRMELQVITCVAAVIVAAVVVVGSLGHPSGGARATDSRSRGVAAGRAPSGAGGSVALAGPDAGSAAGGDPSPNTTAPVPTASPASAAPAVATTPAPPAPTTPTTTTPTTPAPAPVSTPAQLGAEALTLVRYPWQAIPGYTIQFLPISDAPSATFYGNTTFTWGHVGGTSDLYVYPGETVQTLAGITAFEIGHEVDAAAVEPQGGEAQIENILGIHPGSWAPNCDCAEQGYLSGWYAAAFSNYWSPGVGNWSTIAPEPTGAVLTEVEPWLNPTIP